MQHAVPGTCQDCRQGGGGPVGGGAGGGGGVRHAGGQPRAGGRLTLASHHAGQRGGRGEGGGAGAGTGVLVHRGCRRYQYCDEIRILSSLFYSSQY